jgi:hypothetical protein
MLFWRAILRSAQRRRQHLLQYPVALRHAQVGHAHFGHAAPCQSATHRDASLTREATAAALRAYYQAWIKFNGTFTVQIRSEHTAFFDWLESKP